MGYNFEQAFLFLFFSGKARDRALGSYSGHACISKLKASDIGVLAGRLTTLGDIQDGRNWSVGSTASLAIFGAVVST